MERRPAVPGTWESPRYIDSPAAGPPRFRHEEAPQYPPSRPGPLPREAPAGAYYPDGGAWAARAPYKAGQGGDGYCEPPQHGGPQYRPPQAEAFPHGGARPPPGAPHLQSAEGLYGRFSAEGPLPPIGAAPNIPQQRAPELPQGMLPYSAPRDGLPPLGRPPHTVAVRSQENLADRRRESQDVAQRPPHHEDPYRPGERYGGADRVPEERREPLYADSLLPEPFRQGDPSRFRGPDPVPSRYSSSHLSGGLLLGFHRDDRRNPQLAYQNEGSQRGECLAEMYNVNTAPAPDTLHYRPPSPDFLQYSPQPAPTQNPPQQGRYHLPLIQGTLPNPSYALQPPVGSFFSGPLEEADLEMPRLHGNHQHQLLNQQQAIMHQDRQPALDPLLSSGLSAVRPFEHDAPFPHPEVLEGPRDPNLLLPHGGPFIPQPTPRIEDSFMHLNKQANLEEDEPTDKEVFVQWLSGFLSCRRKKPLAKPDAAVEAYSIAEARGLVYGALRLVSQLDSLCQALESRNSAEELWRQDYKKAADIRLDLEKRLTMLERPGYIQGVKRKLDRVRKKRQRRTQAEEEEEKVAAEHCAKKEAGIDLWRMKCVREVEEKKRERELKATADSVLGEVRKKQNDVKKMLDVLKSLEKLRKLRKEAAGRKGVCPPPSADEKFTNHIKRLRTMVNKRSALYDAEEKTLRVILEGEQEEERQRENDRRLKKEREKTLQKQRELDSILFGDAELLPSLHPLQPFRQYYLQAEHSVVSLVQIRHEWDQFLVPPDHPDGGSIPRGWVIPSSPSNDTWATALNQLD